MTIERPSNIERAETQPKSEVVPRDILTKKIRQLHEKQSIALAILFGGDRVSCCDEGVIMEQENRLVGVATIAPEGEDGSGQPTIVGLYVAPEYRGRGIGTQILQKAVERCVERGFEKIRMDVLSLNAMKVIGKLPDELKKKIDVCDLGNIMTDF